MTVSEVKSIGHCRERASSDMGVKPNRATRVVCERETLIVTSSVAHEGVVYAIAYGVLTRGSTHLE